MATLKERSGARKFFGTMIYTADARPCQSWDGRARRWRWRASLFAVALALFPPTARAAPTEPPVWQRELDAARLADATTTLLAGPNAAEANRRVDELFQQLMAKYPRESTVLQAAGDHDWKMERAAAAIAEWQAAQSLDPTNPEIARALGSARLRDGKVREAREQFQRAVDARPEVALYHFELANVLFVFRHDLRAPPSLPDEKTILREALRHFQKASDLAPASLEFARAYADTFYGLPEPDWPTAFAAWERVRTVSGTATDLPNSHLARVSLRMGKPEQAETFLALIHDPLFDPVKTKLQKQADEMKRKAEPAAP